MILYKKTHYTGLKYLGVTAHIDPHVYRGSGKRWLRHIKKHGYNVITEILFESIDIKEIKKMGLYYSKLWNVVESDEWANLIEENGEGRPGGISTSLEAKLKISIALKGKPKSAEHIARVAAATKGKQRSQEYKDMVSATLKGRKLSPEHIANRTAAQKGKHKSVEHGAKMSVYWKGRPKSAEQRAKLSTSLTGKPWSKARRKAYEERV